MTTDVNQDVMAIYERACEYHHRIGNREACPSQIHYQLAERNFYNYCWDTVSQENFQPAHSELIQSKMDDVQQLLDQSNQVKEQLESELSDGKSRLDELNSLHIEAITKGDTAESERLEKAMDAIKINPDVMQRKINAHIEASNQLETNKHIWYFLKRGVSRSIKRQIAESKLPILKEAFASFIKVYEDVRPELREHCPEQLRKLDLPTIDFDGYASLLVAKSAKEGKL